MAKFLMQATYTPEGVQGLMKDGAKKRAAAVKALLKSGGGKLESIHWGIGADEVFMVVDMPDNLAAARVSAVVSAAGYVTLSATPMLTADELDEALSGKGVKYSAPGEA
jgi:uncharacterized protein with GYD domain